MTKLKDCLRRVVQFPGFWFCIMAFAVLFMILEKQEFWTGYDTYFHMNAIYEDAMQIKTGHFSYFISMFGFERSGRIVNSLYGPFFNYFCGGLLLLCHSWINFEFVLFFATMVISGFGLYGCARLLRINRTNATILGLLYMISRPIMTMWIGSFEFTGLGAAILLPFVLMMGIEIFQQRRIKIVPLAVMMTICLQIHLITSLVAVIVLVPLAFFGFIASYHRWKMLRNGFLSAILAFCLSGNVFGAIDDLYTTNTLIPTFPNFNLQTTAGTKTISLQGHTITDLGHLYTFLLLLVGLCFVLRLIVNHHSVKGLDWILLLEDLFFLLISSTYFPWDRLVKHVPELSNIIQFPSRFVTMPFLLTLLLVGRLCRFSPSKRQKNYAVSVILAILLITALPPTFNEVNQLSAGWQSNGVLKYWTSPTKYGGFRYSYKGNRIRSAVRSHDLTRGVNVVHKITTDYMPTTPKMNIYNYYYWPTDQLYIKTFRNPTRFSKSVKNHALWMTWNSKNQRNLQVPLVKYGNTSVIFNHKQINPKISMIGAINVKPRKGLNVMRIKYQPGYMFKLLSLLSILSWLCLLIRMVYIRLR